MIRSLSQNIHIYRILLYQHFLFAQLTSPLNKLLRAALSLPRPLNMAAMSMLMGIIRSSVRLELVELMTGGGGWEPGAAISWLVTRPANARRCVADIVLRMGITCRTELEWYKNVYILANWSSEIHITNS